MNNIALVPLINRGSDSYFPPLGVLYLARAVLNLEEGWHVSIVEKITPSDQFSPTDFWDFEKVVEDVQKTDSDITGISCFTFTLPLALQIAQEVKKRDPTTIVVLGGSGPSGVGEKILSRFPAIDYVVDGEGEKPFADLLHVLDGGTHIQDVKGIVYRENGKILHTGPQKRLVDLDGLGFPAYELVDMKAYRSAGVMWHRGCPYGCSFCDVSQMWGKKVVSRSIDHVVQEIDMLRTEFGVKVIQFFDDTFTLKKDDTLDMCRKVKNLDVRWSANCRINTVSRELLEGMIDAGCKGIFYGIESGSDRILKAINKKITVRDVLTAIKNTPKSLLVKSSFIWNYPFETLDDFYKSFLLASYLTAQRIQVRHSPLSLLSQSPFYHQYKDKLVTDVHKNIQWNNMLNQNVLNSSGLSIPNWVRDMVFENTDIFPGLLWVESPHVEEKVKFVRKYMQVMGQF